MTAMSRQPPGCRRLKPTGGHRNAGGCGASGINGKIRTPTKTPTMNLQVSSSAGSAAPIIDAKPTSGRTVQEPEAGTAQDRDQNARTKVSVTRP